MITFEDCIAFSELDAETLHVIAARFDIPDIAAAQFGGASMRVPAAGSAIAPVTQRNVSRPR